MGGPVELERVEITRCDDGARIYVDPELAPKVPPKKPPNGSGTLSTVIETVAAAGIAKLLGWS